MVCVGRDFPQLPLASRSAFMTDRCTAACLETAPILRYHSTAGNPDNARPHRSNPRALPHRREGKPQLAVNDISVWQGMFRGIFRAKDTWECANVFRCSNCSSQELAAPWLFAARPELNPVTPPLPAQFHRRVIPVFPASCMKWKLANLCAHRARAVTHVWW